MPKRADITIIHSASNAQYNAGGGSQYLIQTPSGVLYLIYNDVGADVCFKKSTDGGLTWSNHVVVFAGAIISLSVWYDRWSGISAGLIHIAYTDSALADTLYRTIDTESSDALSTQTTIFAGSSAVTTGSSLSISRARGGNVYCRTCIDAGAEGGFFRLPNANVPNGAWDAARTVNEALATLDMAILLPGFAADNQDMILIFWDASANEISRQVYDDSANSWAESSIATSMVEVSPANQYPHFAAAVDLTNSRHILIAWNGVDTASARLRAWHVSEAAITALTDVVSSSTDDQGLAGITLDLQSGYYWAFYGGKTDGSETFGTSINIYYKISNDNGSTWGSETQLTTLLNEIRGIYPVMRQYIGAPQVFYMTTTTGSLAFYRVNAEVGHPTANFQLGI